MGTSKILRSGVQMVRCIISYKHNIYSSPAKEKQEAFLIWYGASTILFNLKSKQNATIGVGTNLLVYI